jgi:hypothetical protein
VSTNEPTEVPEAEARGAVAESYASIRRALGSAFVPTVYRRLAVHPDALATAVAVLPEIVEAAQSTGYTDDLMRTAASLVRPVRGSVAPAPPGAADVVARYRAANPINLLFAVSLLDTADDGADRPAVMEPSLPPAAAAEEDDIRACHGGQVLPGLWRELGGWREWRSSAWAALRQDAAAGGLVSARTAVMTTAVGLGSATAVHAARHEVASLLPAAAALELRRFPAVIASMVVEAEWLVRAMKPHTEE